MGEPLDMLKDTCGALGGLLMMDRVPLQVAVISPSHGEGQRGQILSVGSCVWILSVCIQFATVNVTVIRFVTLLGSLFQSFKLLVSIFESVTLSFS